MTIDRRKILELLSAAPAEGLQAADLTVALDLPRDHRTQVRRLLKELTRAGLVIQRGRHFSMAPQAIERVDAADLAAAEGWVEGRLQVTPQGHGYVDLDDAAYDGILVEEMHFAGAIDGDRVAVEITGGRHGGRSHGRVRAIRLRGRKRVVGTLSGPPWQLQSDDPRLSVPIVLEDPKQLPRDLKARDGLVAVAEIVTYPQAAGEPLVVRPQAILGEPGELLTEVSRILWELGVSEAWEPALLEQAAATPQAVAPEDCTDPKRRSDLRDLPFVTIDPETAKDFDDAVCATRLPDGTLRVWVAIADVAYYVQEDSPIDVEARLRGCSVYLPGRAIPMLPDALSSGICSLLPEVDRLAMVVRFEVALDGAVRAEQAEAAVINSRARFDYPGVAAALAGDFRGRRAHYQAHVEHLVLLAEAAERLRRRRVRRGALTALDLPEAKVVLDEDDPARVRDVVAARAEEGERAAYNLIEELMLAANEAVARLFVTAGEPTIWRIHQEPRQEALEKLVLVLSAYGVHAELPELVTSGGMNKLLAGIANHPAARPLAYQALRALCQAEYNVENRGHFGLASEGYLHFTSPIRRYPDLHVHRLLKRLLNSQGRPAGAGARVEVRQRDEAALRRLSKDSSENERRALDVERRMVALYSAALLRDRIGDEVSGTVLGVSSFGVFVGLDAPHVEGMVRFDSLPGRVEFNADYLRLEGRFGAPSLRLGDRLQVRIAGASLSKRQIDLEYLGGGVVQRDEGPTSSRRAPEAGGPARSGPRGKTGRIPGRFARVAARGKGGKGKGKGKRGR